MSEISEHDSFVVDADITPQRQQLDAAFEQQRDLLLNGIKAHLWSQGLTRDYTTLTELAEEVLQETAETAYRIADQYDPARPARPWLLAIALNHVRNLRRAHDRDERHLVPVAETPQARAAYRNADGPLSDDTLFDLLVSPVTSSEVDDRFAVEALLTLVRDDDRRVLQMKFVDNISYRELAAALGVSEGAAYTRISRAISRLRTAYMQRITFGQED